MKFLIGLLSSEGIGPLSCNFRELLLEGAFPVQIDFLVAERFICAFSFLAFSGLTHLKVALNNVNAVLKA